MVRRKFQAQLSSPNSNFLEGLTFLAEFCLPQTSRFVVRIYGNVDMIFNCGTTQINSNTTLQEYVFSYKVSRSRSEISPSQQREDRMQISRCL